MVRRRLLVAVAAAVMAAAGGWVLPRAPTAAGLTFVLPSGGRRCFTDAVPPATRVYGEIFVTAAHGSMPVDVAVYADSGTGALMYRRENVDHVKFAFTSPSVGGGGGGGGQGGRHPAPPRVVDGREATSARAARAARAALAAAAAVGTGTRNNPGGGGGGSGGDGVVGGGGGGGGDSSGVDSIGHRRSLLQVPPAGAKAKSPDDDPRADDFSLEDSDWEDPDGAAAPPASGFGGGVGTDAEDGGEDALWTSGRYELCVSHNGAVQPAAGVSRRIRLTLSSGSSAHDWGGLALREHLGTLQLSLAQTAAELDGLTARMDEVKRREESLARFNSATGGRVVRAAAVSVGVLLAVSAGQAWAVWRQLNKRKVL